ncbi:MAG: restriction endonuclease subunit S [Opitutae bacterium]|nr:restriction endonuclease subunit S [Opitutae bacterium]
MSEWTETTLGRVSEIVMGQSPPGTTYNEDGVGLPLINGPVEFGKRFPTAVQWTTAPTKTCNPDDVLICVRGSTTGRINISNDTFCIGRGIAAIRGRSGLATTPFLEFVLRELAAEILEEARGSGSTFPSITGQRLAGAKVQIPNLSHQRRIAEILGTVDEAIEATEALIAKQQQVKAGLMHDLFTRGLTPTGQLRPPRAEAPALYHETPLGWLPREWTVKCCHQVCSSIIDCKNRTPPITEEGHPVIRTPNVRHGRFVRTNLVYTDALSYQIWTARGKPQVGDIVITREAPVGEVCMIPPEIDAACLGQRMMLYRPNPDHLDAYFLLHVLQSVGIQKRLDVISGGSTVGHVKVGDIRDLQIPYPTPAEQLSIASILAPLESTLAAETARLAKLREQKQGLMQALLTPPG